MTTRIAAVANQHRRIADLSPEDAARVILDRSDRHPDRFDDHISTGHGVGTRMWMFAMKPAPVQVSYGAYPMSAGLSAIDYRTLTRTSIAGESDQYSVEKLLRIDSFWCYPVDGDSPAVGELPAQRKRLHHFGSMKSPAKASPQSIKIWSRRAERGPRFQTAPLVNDAGREEPIFLQQFARHGIDPQRVQTVGRLRAGSTSIVYNQIDIELDSTPCNCHTTTLEAMWMGVPVVTSVAKPGTPAAA